LCPCPQRVARRGQSEVCEVEERQLRPPQAGAATARSPLARRAFAPLAVGPRPDRRTGSGAWPLALRQGEARGGVSLQQALAYHEPTPAPQRMQAAADGVGDSPVAHQVLQQCRLGEGAGVLGAASACSQSGGCGHPSDTLDREWGALPKVRQVLQVLLQGFPRAEEGSRRASWTWWFHLCRWLACRICRASHPDGCSPPHSVYRTGHRGTVHAFLFSLRAKPRLHCRKRSSLASPASRFLRPVAQVTRQLGGPQPGGCLLLPARDGAWFTSNRSASCLLVCRVAARSAKPRRAGSAFLNAQELHLPAPLALPQGARGVPSWQPRSRCPRRSLVPPPPPRTRPDRGIVVSGPVVAPVSVAMT